MHTLIPIINRLQDVFNTVGIESIDLPQIVVIGSQSSGKSSVLENIVGRDFLPRGMGIVTRRPLVLQLNNLSGQPGKKQSEWGEFLHKPNQVFTNFAEIRQEIENETDRETGKNKGISNVPINLKIFSPHVLNLTLVDLPGMTRVPVGDQPSDIEQQIRGMILNYITKPNAIILAVTAANTDIANSDSLHLAREVDPDGARTIGVITKIDIMDQGTDALDLLMGRIIPLRLGYVGVINRSQKDIIQGKAIRESLKAEALYFSTHAQYRTIASRCGTPYLSKSLNKLLMSHIRDCIPELKARVSKLLAEAQSEMMTYGDPLYDGKNSQGALLLQVITRFSTDFRNAIDGKSTDHSFQELYGGARINYIFNEIFSRCIHEIDPNDGMTQNDIRTVIRNATGPRAALFVPEASFDLLVKRQITRLEEPSLQCVELVYDELQRIISQLESKELLRFSNLRERVVEVVNNLLHKCRNPTKIMIGNLISIEMSYINTNHPDFVGGGGAMSQVFSKMAQAHQQEAMAAQQQQMQQQQMMQAGWDAQHGQPQPSTSKKTKKSKKKDPSSLKPVHPQPTAGQEKGFFGMFFGGNNAQGQGPQHSMQPTGGPPTSKPRKKSSSSRSRMKVGPTSSRSSPNTAVSHLPRVPTTIKAINTPTEKERFETELIQSLLVSYFGIVRKNVQDTVPKSIMHFLVNQAKDSVQNELVAHLYKEDLFDDLLEESPAIAQRRRQCKQRLDALRKAQMILGEVRDAAI
eukprot:TRINITY_DN2382_c0_g1_i1.p1 TRINITY_DN2382_c0_g1~~TRINITY_DN2382_c0_g1_i1.p1  ORF type:complete len:748 (-),score=116.19 TRINITY_DN2382_c0_g1_i1:43-2286(-)